MEIIISLVIVAIGVALYFNRKSPTLDVNKDGNVDVKDVVAADVKVEEAVVTEVKEVVTKVKAAAKKVPAKTAAAKKTTASKKV